MRAREFITEKWSNKYKNSINCSNPKGFSQKAHCQGRKKNNEDIDIGKEWMSDTELDDFIPSALQDEWRELVGYNEEGDAHPLWVNMTGDYEPNSKIPQHRKWMIEVANKWVAMKRIPNVQFYGVRDIGDELEWLVQIGPSEQQLQERRKKRKVKYAAYGPGPYGLYGYDAGYSGSSAGTGVEEDTNLKEFAPAGSGNDKPPRGPKTPGKDPWGDNDPGEDPYSKPVPEYYSRSIDFFGRFEADHFDDEEFNERTGEFKGYWDDEEGRIQIAYFKFDNPSKTGSDDPGMGWYYEPQTESLLREFSPAGGDGGDNYGGDLYDILMGYISQNYPDLIDHFGEDLVDTVVSNMVSMGSFENINPENTEDLEDAVANILTQLEDENLNENFADGRNPQDKGDSKRHGVPTKASISTLRKVAKQGGRKGQLAHWMANMKAGKAKKK